MRDEGVSEALAALLRSDPDVADREELGALIRHARKLRGWVDAADVRFARRGRELAAAGESEAAGVVLMDEGRRSGKEAQAAEDRERVCSELPGFEDALATGAVSGDHLDVLARHTRNLSDAERADLHAVRDELLDRATSEYVSSFDRHCKDVVTRIRELHAPDDDAAELDRQRDMSTMKRWVDRATGMHKTLVELDPIRDAALHGAIDAQLARLKQQAGAADRPFDQLLVDALVAAVSADEPAPRTPEVSVLIDHGTLCDGRHAATICETSNGVPLPISTVRRLCCEAEIIPIVLGGEGEALDAGRSHRTATRAQRRALRAMYRTCAHPHCEVGFDRCRIHHVLWWWEHAGRTDLDNLIPLCESHHHLVHEGRWTLAMTPDRVVTWSRPDGTVWWHGQSINRTRGLADDAPIDGPPAATGHRQPALC